MRLSLPLPFPAAHHHPRGMISRQAASPPSAPNQPWGHHLGCSRGSCLLVFDPWLWACCLCYRDDLYPAPDLWKSPLKYACKLHVYRLYSSVYHIRKSPHKQKLSLKLRQASWQNMQGSWTHEFLYFTPSLTSLCLASGEISCAPGKKIVSVIKIYQRVLRAIQLLRKTTTLTKKRRRRAAGASNAGGLLSWHLGISLRHGAHIFSRLL